MLFALWPSQRDVKIVLWVPVTFGVASLYFSVLHYFT